MRGSMEMAITINFSEKYGNLICKDLPKKQLKSVEDRGGYLTEDNKSTIPEKYRKVFVHPPEGFVKLFCEEY